MHGSKCPNVGRASLSTLGKMTKAIRRNKNLNACPKLIRVELQSHPNREIVPRKSRPSVQ